MVKSDKWIRKMAREYRLIEPFNEKLISKGRISYGLSSYGYDIRLDNRFKMFIPQNEESIDPKKIKHSLFQDVVAQVCLIPPHSFLLARSMEYIRIPRNILGLCVGKSTYTRCGIIVNVTPLEPMWEGYLTIEISNNSSLPAKLYAGEGIAQIIFLEANEPCEVSYVDREGKYHQQREITIAKVE